MGEIENAAAPYWSCTYIETGITFNYPGLVFCCDRLPPEVVSPTGDAGEAVDAFLAMRERVI